MKKNLLLLVLSCFFIATTISSFAQYHLRNGDMAIWDNVGANGEHARYWNSMKNGATGGMASLAPRVVWRSTNIPPISGITYSVMMQAQSTLGIIANGQMTTGCVNAASMTPNTPNSNYNYTRRGSSYAEFNQPIIGTPDYIRFWAKCANSSLSDSARVNAVIHDDYDYHDPEGTGGSASQWIGKATLNFTRVGGTGGTWAEYEVPFVYEGPSTSNPAYILVTFTTNKTPGGGANKDELYVTAVELIYSAWLSDLKINGATIDGFQNRLLTYGGPTLSGTAPYAFPYPNPEEVFSYTPEVNDILGVEITNVPGPNDDADEGYTSIVVTAEDGITKVEYRVYYFAHLSNNNTVTAMSYSMDETPVPVPGFTPSQVSYSINLPDPEEARIPKIIPESIVLADPTANVQNIIQPTGVNSTGKVIVQAENYSTKTYNLIFTKALSSNSKLTKIQIANVNIPDFDPDVLEYNYTSTACVTSIPTVTYEKASLWANVNYTAATLVNRTAIITVTAEDKTSTVYKVNFILTSDDVKFTNIRFGTSTANQMPFSAGKTVYESAYSFTSAPSALTMTLSCTGASVSKSPATNVFNPDTNYFTVTAQDGIAIATYKAIIKNTNYALTTGNNNAFRFNYNGLVNQNTGINVTSTNNGNTNTVTTTVVTVPVGPNVPPELVILPTGFSAAVAPPTYTIVQPAHRNDTAIVTLTANDGVTKKIYRVPFKATLSGDATLNNMTYNGFQVPGFNPATESYMLIFPSNVTEVPEINYLPTFEWLPEENISYTPAATLSDTTVIVVTAENGTTKKTYKIYFEVVEQEKDAYLMDIKHENKSLKNFNPTQYNYTEDIPYSSPIPPVVTPFASSPTALVFPSLQLNVPPYTQSFLVYSEDMTVHHIYTVNFNLIKNTNPYLADIQINGVSLQDFNSQMYEYDVELPYMEMNAPVVTATPAYQYAHVIIQQIDTIMGTVTISVTAEDDTFSEDYLIHFTRELSPVLTIETIHYDYNDESYTYEVTTNDNEYTIMLPVETEGEPAITGIFLADDRANAVIEEQPDETNNFTGTVVVTAEDATEETYSVIFERTLSESTLLTGISYNGVPVPNFHQDTLTYEIMLPYTTSQIQNVSATVAWKNTIVAIAQATQPFGQATVTVTSEDGANSKVYTIIFLRKGTPYLVALSYNLDGISTAISNFNALTYNYDIELEMATTTVPVLEYILEDTRCTVQRIDQITPNGASQLKIFTWNMDDSVTYSVNFKVLISTDPILNSIFVDGEPIVGFNPNTLHYTIPEFPYGTEELPVVTAVAKYPDATVVYEQIEGLPGTAAITVTAGDLSTSTYTVSFSVDLGNNTYLAELLIGGYPWHQFKKDVYFYEIVFPYGTTEIPEVDGTHEDETSIVTVEQAHQFGDTAKITITAINGDVAIYYVYFPMPKSNNAQASMIYIDWEPLEGFVSYQTEYWVNLPVNYTGKPDVEVIPVDPNATVKDFTTPPAEFTIAKTVTAENGIDELTYTIHFQKLNSILTYTDAVEINVYPNPTSSIIHFEVKEFDQASRLEIYSIEGKKVGSNTLQNGINTINVEHLQQGIYIYKIFSEQTMLGAGKFVKN